MLGEVAALAHEAGDDPVEAGALVRELLAAGTHALLTSAEAAEVLCGLGHHVRAEHHLDATGGLAVDHHFEEHTRVGSCLRHRGRERRGELQSSWLRGRALVDCPFGRGSRLRLPLMEQGSLRSPGSLRHESVTILDNINISVK
eukprot:COSAG06_NODE_3758_length_4939_cov_1.872727_3_plen_144_part_00